MENLVVNGCSYSEVYALGHGHIDLAQRLNIQTASSIALGGGSNSRILRTTTKHAYTNKIPTLYVIGLTFMSRWEIPIASQRPNMEFEGRWINPQAQFKETRQENWTDNDTVKFTELNCKSVSVAMDDQFEDLIYRCLNLADFLRSRNHRVLFFNQCGPDTSSTALNPKFDFLKNHNEFVNQLTWIAITWQHEQGVRAVDYSKSNQNISVKNLPPPELTHRAPGEHHKINEFLTNYINEHKILQ